MTTKGTAAAALAALLATACNRSPNVLQATVTPETVTDTRVVVNAPGLAEEVRYGEVVARREGRILHVQVALENSTHGDLPVEYRWEWTDDAGMQVGETLSSWHPLLLGGGQRALVTGVGPTENAREFRLYVRRGKS